MSDPLSASIDRRDFLRLLGVGAIAPMLARADTLGISLGELAAAKGLRFGSAVSAGANGIGNPQLADLLKRECRIIVPENELKMYVIRADSHPDSYNFEPAERMLSFCQSAGLAMRGHNLYWAKDKYTPRWLLNQDFGRQPKLAAEKILRAYIAGVCGHFGERLTSWDVVNEAIDEKTGELRDTVMWRILGQDFLRICFEAAREQLPHVQLVYNDYMSWGRGDDKHRGGVLKLLRWFRDTKLPVDALGIQGHITAHDGRAGSAEEPDLKSWTHFLDAAAAMDYTLLLTEFDVSDRAVVGDIPVRDRIVAETAKRYLDLLLSYPSLRDFLVWGLDDRHSWLRNGSGRADGLPLRPTLYDDQLQPKALREVVAAALRAAPLR